MYSVCVWPDAPVDKKNLKKGDKNVIKKTFMNFIFFMDKLNIQARPIVLFTTESHDPKYDDRPDLIFKIKQDNILEFVSHKKKYHWMWNEEYYKQYFAIIPVDAAKALELNTIDFE